MKLPRLMDRQKNEIARLHPSKVKITEKLQPINSATVTLPAGEPDVLIGYFIELYVPHRSAGIYRVSNVSRDFVTGTQTISLEHGAVTLGDFVVPGEYEFFGWDDGDPETTITGYKATQYYYLPQYNTDSIVAPSVSFTNKDGSHVSLSFYAGMVIPVLAFTDEGWRVPVTQQLVDMANHMEGNWDGTTVSGTMNSRTLADVTQYSNAFATAQKDVYFFLRPYPDERMHVITAGTRLTIYGKVEGAKATPYYAARWVNSSGDTLGGYVLTSDIVLDAGWEIAPDAGEAKDNFRDVGNKLINAVKEHYQGVEWEMGESDFAECFGYKFNDANLLTAILSLPEKLRSKYRWEFDQSGMPWIVRLKKLDEENVAELRRTRNLSKMQMTVNATGVVTCVLPRGLNGLTVESVNDGSPYVTSESAEDYWHAEAITSSNVSNPSALFEAAVTYLQEHSEPSVSIAVSAIDLSEMTGEPLDRLEVGKVCRVALPEYGLTVNEVITAVTYEDVYGAPEKVSITLSNSKETASGMLSKLLNK